jgi:predicted RNA polymerase sigma factor
VSATDPHHATHQALHRTIEAVWRIESARVIAGLTRLTRDVGLAEDLAQEALVAALEQWPQSVKFCGRSWHLHESETSAKT